LGKKAKDEATGGKKGRFEKKRYSTNGAYFLKRNSFCSLFLSIAKNKSRRILGDLKKNTPATGGERRAWERIFKKRERGERERERERIGGKMERRFESWRSNNNSVGIMRG